MTTFRYARDPVCLGAIAVYLINRFAVKPFTGDPADFFHCYLNDVLCLPFWLPLALWVQRRLGVRKNDLPPTVGEIALHWVVWSWFFEAFAPSLPGLFPRTVMDPWDVVAYAAGGLLAGMLWRSAWNPTRRDRRAWRPWWIHGGVVASIMASVVVLAVVTGYYDPIAHIRPQLQNRLWLTEVAEALTRYRAEHGTFPDRLERLHGVPIHLVDAYHHDAATFELIAYGDDRRPGGLGDAEDVHVPADRQPPSPWYGWFFTFDADLSLRIACVLGTLMACAWLAQRALTTPPFAPLRLRSVVVLVAQVGIALFFATAILSFHRTSIGVH